MSPKKSKKSFPYWKPIVLSPRGRLRSSSPSERIYPLSTDPRYVLDSVGCPPPQPPRRIDKKPAPREYEEHNEHYPGLSKNLTGGLEHRFQLEDLRISGERKKGEMARLGQSQWCSPTPAANMPDTVNKRLLRQESVTDLRALPDLFTQPANDTKSTECLNKRVFTAGSLQDLKAIPSIEARTTSASNHAYKNVGRSIEFGTLSLDDLRALPSLSCYYDDKDKEKSNDASTAKDVQNEPTTPPTRDSEDGEEEPPQK